MPTLYTRRWLNAATTTRSLLAHRGPKSAWELTKHEQLKLIYDQRLVRTGNQSNSYSLPLGMQKWCCHTGRQLGRFSQSQHNLTGQCINPTPSIAAPHPWAPGFQCLQFQLSANNCGPKMLGQASRSKQFINLKLHNVPSCLIKISHSPALAHLGQESLFPSLCLRPSH